VDHGIDLVGAEHGFQTGAVAYVDVGKHDRLAGNVLDALLHHFLRIRQVVDHHHVVASLDQFNAGMGTDIAHAACNEYFHFYLTLSFIIFVAAPCVPALPVP
jgi:hypothetical protein